jgi:hypothetical protein
VHFCGDDEFGYISPPIAKDAERIVMNGLTEKIIGAAIGFIRYSGLAS